jgi:sugar O-acyltransferase (sialic acid O-acetyltransferase NeuD family)
MKKIILIGAGGHAKSCIDIIENLKLYKIVGLIDNQKKIGEKLLNYKVIGNDKDLSKICNQFKNLNCHISLGSILDQGQREKLFLIGKKLGLKFPVLKSKKSYVSKYCNIGEGTIVMHDVVLNANVMIGKNCILNTKSLIEHDAIINDHSQISTGVIINSAVVVGKKCFIGSNTVIKQTVKIKSNSFINMGNKVFRDV